jgi:hypothetical protein
MGGFRRHIPVASNGMQVDNVFLYIYVNATCVAIILF